MVNEETIKLSGITIGQKQKAIANKTLNYYLG